jgi:SSS family solute:Na+ symporter/sodium/pantothenate symporter
MTPLIFKYLLVAIFTFITFYLSYKGMKRTSDIKSFSIGNKDMSPIMIGITMAASIASTATFVINPGFIYVHGLAAYVHFGIAASAGVLCAFILLSKGFRKIGDQQGSLTIPDWIFHRYGNRGLSLFFAFINLLSITFVVLILVGCSLLMADLFSIPQKMGLVITLVFVFSYVLMGGSYAHAYTNSFQGIMMLIIASFLFVQGLHHFDGGFINALSSVSTNYASVFNPESNLYYNFFSVFVSGFVITFALMLQPHILTKILYIKDDKDVSKFILTTAIVGVFFSLILFIGFYAKLSGLVIARQDAVVIVYIKSIFSNSAFGAYISTFVSITLLAAGMSTLDGILVSLSAMMVNDIYAPLQKKRLDPKKALIVSRYTLIGVGLFSGALAWNPPALVGLFAQKGVYGLAAASVFPILLGVLYRKDIPIPILWLSALIGLGGHLGLNLTGVVLNPAVSSTYAIMASVGTGLILLKIYTVNNNKLVITDKLS